MIQRIQTLWLFVAAVLNAGLLYFDIYRVHNVTNGVDTTVHLRVMDNFPSLLIALIIIALPLVSIFLFKNRKKQRNMVLLSVVTTIGFIALAVMRVGNLTNSTNASGNGSYWIGAILPVISIIFLIMAMRGISKDQKLVKSLDRLR